MDEEDCIIAYEEKQAELREAYAVLNANKHDEAYRERLAQSVKTMKADEGYRERLAQCISEAIDAIRSGYYPAPLSSLYLCMLEVDDTGMSILLPVVEGAAESDKDEKPERPGRTHIWERYGDALCDDNGNLQTKIEFLSLQRKFATPAEAVPSLVESLVLKGSITAEEAPQMTLVWSAWLRPQSWRTLSGRLVYDHCVGNIARKFQSVDEDLLRMEGYVFHHPKHRDFLRELNYDEDEIDKEMPGVPQATRDCFVRVWHSDDAETKQSDLLLLVDEAFQRNVYCSLLAGRDTDALLILDELFQEKRKRSDEIMPRKGSSSDSSMSS